MAIVRRTRYPEFMTLRDAVDRMFEDALLPTAAANGNGHGHRVVPFDVVEREDELVVRAPVPGFTSEDIDITIQGEVLTVTGRYEREEADEKDSYHLREWRAGSFRRAISLPEQVDASKATAEVTDGVLTLTLPKSEAVKPRKIEVRSS